MPPISSAPAWWDASNYLSFPCGIIPSLCTVCIYLCILQALTGAGQSLGQAFGFRLLLCSLFIPSRPDLSHLTHAPDVIEE